MPGALIGLHFATFHQWDQVAPDNAQKSVLFYAILLPLAFVPPAWRFARQESWAGPMRFGAVMGTAAWLVFMVVAALGLGDLGGFSFSHDPWRFALGLSGILALACVPALIGVCVGLVGARIGSVLHGIRQRRAASEGAA